MLKPLFFPFTHLGDRAAALLQAHFAAVLLLRPFEEGLPPGMRELERRGFLEIPAPLPGDAAGGAAAIGPLQEWARRHAGGAGVTGAFWHARLAGDPLGGERSAFQLASQIRHRPLPGQHATAADPLPAARFFLRLAQELDEQEEEVLRCLARCQIRSAQLTADMAGRSGPSSSGPAAAGLLPPSGREEHRLPERLSAWALLFQVYACPGPVLVTTSAAAVEQLLELSASARRLPIGENQRRGAASPEGQRASTVPLIAELEGWATAPAARIDSLPLAGAGNRPVTERGNLLAYLFPGQDPHRLFSRLAAPGLRSKTANPNARVWEHTLVVLVPAVSGAYSS